MRLVTQNEPSEPPPVANAPGEDGGHRDKAIKKIDEALREIPEASDNH